MNNIKLSDYYEIINPKYRYLKIIPHTSAKNNKSDDIAAIVNSMYKSLKVRVTKENSKLTIKSQCKLSYYIYITKENVSFYFIVPDYYLSLIKNKINSTWGNKINIEEVSQIPTFSENCSKCQMTYKNKDGLSLATDKRNNDLLSNNLSVIDTMKDNDAVGIVYNMMPMSPRQQKTWITRYNEDYEAYNKSRNIEKIKLEPRSLIYLAFFNLIKGLDFFIKEIQAALAKENMQIEAVNQVSSVIENRKVLSKSTIKKKTDTIIKTQIAVLSESRDKTQQEKLLDTVANSFEIIKDDNKLIPKATKSNFEFTDFDFKLDDLECSDKELSNAIAIPGRELLSEYSKIEKNEINESTLPDELKNGYIKLGENKYKNSNEMAYFNAKPSLASLPIALLGGSRSGKSTFTENISEDILEHDECLIILDFIKDTELSTNIKNIAPTNRVIDLDLCNPDCYQAFSYNEIQVNDSMNTLEKIKCSNRQIVQILNLIDSINADGIQLTGKMCRYLLSAGKLVFLKKDKGLKDVVKCLQNHNYRNELINNLTKEYREYLEEDIDNLLELNEYDKNDKERANPLGTKDSKIEGILDRINLLKRDPNMNLMYSLGPANNINFIKAMDEGKIILIRLREDEFYDKVSKSVLVTFFITKIWLSILMRSKNENSRRCTVIIDEIFQTPMAQKLIGQQLVQSAKFNLKYILTLHYLNQLAPDTKEALKSANCSYCLISGCDKKAFKELEEEFNINGYELEDLLKLEEYHSLNLIKTSKSYASFITKLPPPIN